MLAHGGKDVGTSYKDIYEKDINLEISLYLKDELDKYGATVLLIRERDYDISSPNINRRKKSDFDNRIKISNENNTSYLFLYIKITIMIQNIKEHKYFIKVMKN